MRYDMKKLIAVLVAAAFAGTAFQAIAQGQPSAPTQAATPATPEKAQAKKSSKPAKSKKKAKSKKAKAEPKN
jgi:hypothetical protein